MRITRSLITCLHRWGAHLATPPGETGGQWTVCVWAVQPAGAGQRCASAPCTGHSPAVEFTERSAGVLWTFSGLYSVLSLDRQTDRQTDRQRERERERDIYIYIYIERERERERERLLVGCLTSQQHANVPQVRIFSDNFTCCHTEIEVAV